MKTASIQLMTLIFLVLFAGCGTREMVRETDDHKPRTYPTRAVQKFSYGELYRIAGDYSRALIEYEEAAALDSLSPAIYARIGEMYMALSRMSKARSAFSRSVKLDPDQPELYDMIAMTLVMDNKRDEAEKTWLQLIDSYPEYPDAWFNLSDLYFEFNKTDKGLAVLIDLSERDPENREVLGRIVDIFHQLGRYEESIPFLKKLISLSPETGRFYQSLYRAYMEMGKEDEAKETIRQWRSHVKPSPQSELLYADMLVRGRYWDEALQLLSAGHERWPDHWAFPHLMAIVYIEKEEPDSVKKYYNIALSQDSALPVAFQNYAVWLAERDDLPEALEVILEGRSVYPEHPELMYLEALFLDEADEPVKAIRVLENLRTLQPENQNALHMLAALYDRTGQVVRAENIYEEILQKNSDDHLVLNNYSYLLAEAEQDLDRAWEMIRKALDLDPDNPAYLDTAAWILYKLNRFEDALNYIDQALSFVSDDHEILYHKAIIILSLKSEEEAIPYLEESLKINPDFEPARAQWEELHND